MRYFLDAEFNGFGGQLIALALVPSEVGLVPFYEVLPCHEPVPWVVEHVLPVLQREAISRENVTRRLVLYLRDDAEPVVVSNWPEDIAHLALLMVTGPGWRMPSPRMIFELLDLPLFDAESLSSVPHNAREDAMALRAYVWRRGFRHGQNAGELSGTSVAVAIDCVDSVPATLASVSIKMAISATACSRKCSCLFSFDREGQFSGERRTDTSAGRIENGTRATSVYSGPQAARAMLMYRFATLPAARAKAARLGWRGAMFAWESADTGVEATPDHAIGSDRKVVQILCGKQEQHITADIAYAVWQYWQATGDEGFLRCAGAEILLEAGRFWASRARLENDGHCHIRGVIGPDEYHETVDDNAFTNVMARWTIRRAIEIAALLHACWPAEWTRLSSHLELDDHELGHWQAVADAMATGLDPKTGLFEQFEGYFGLVPIDLASYAGRSVPMDVVLGRERTAKSRLVKQADVVALLGLLPEEFVGDTGATNFDYYAPQCSHGSSLSRAMHGLAAARLGRSEMALDFLRATSAIDLADTLAAIDGGVHIAALGGVWMITVLGIAGLKLLPDALAIDPQLPAGWSNLDFACQWRSRLLRFRVDSAAERLHVTLEAGEPMTLVVQGVPHEITGDSGFALRPRGTASGGAK